MWCMDVVMAVPQSSAGGRRDGCALMQGPHMDSVQPLPLVWQPFSHSKNGELFTCNSAAQCTHPHADVSLASAGP